MDASFKAKFGWDFSLFSSVVVFAPKVLIKLPEELVEGAGATKLKPVVDAVLGLNFLSFDVNDFVLLSVSKLNPEEAEGVNIVVFVPKLKLDVDVVEDFGFLSFNSSFLPVDASSLSLPHAAHFCKEFPFKL